MAKARIKKTLTTVLRYGAARRTLTASGGGQTYSMDLPAVGPESGMLRETAMAIRDSAHQLSALAKTVCELHGITDQPSPAKAKRRRSRPRGRRKPSLTVHQMAPRGCPSGTGMAMA